jgi:hypothetical protein
MSKTIWVFGNSYSSENNELKGWPTILSERFGYSLKNTSTDKTSNYQIFDDFCFCCDLIKTNDIVIIGWDLVENFRACVGSELINISKDDIEFDGISKNYIDDTIKDRQSEKWCEQIYYYENLIDELSKTKGFRTFYWSSNEDRLIYPNRGSFKAKRAYLCSESEVCLVKYFNEKGVGVNENRFANDGQQIVADIFYNEITKRLSSL